MIVKIEGCKIEVDNYHEPEGDKWSCSFSFSANEDLFKTVSALLKLSKFEFTKPNGETIIARATRWSYTKSPANQYKMKIELERYEPKLTADDIYLALIRSLIYDLKLLKEILKLKGIISEKDYEELFKNEELMKKIKEDIVNAVKRILSEEERLKREEETNIG